MGLDMYLYRVEKDRYETDEVFTKTLEAYNSHDWRSEPDDYPDINLDYEARYWRKANAIHDWFVRTCQANVDNCQYSYVTRTDLERLLDLCAKVSMNHSKAKELLPTAEGFFFGSYNYDEWYYQYVDETAEDIHKLLEEDKNEYYYVYHSSW